MSRRRKVILKRWNELARCHEYVIPSAKYVNLIKKNQHTLSRCRRLVCVWTIIAQKGKKFFIESDASVCEYDIEQYFPEKQIRWPHLFGWLRVWTRLEVDYLICLIMIIVYMYWKTPLFLDNSLWEVNYLRKIITGDIRINKLNYFNGKIVFKTIYRIGNHCGWWYLRLRFPLFLQISILSNRKWHSFHHVWMWNADHRKMEPFSRAIF